MLDQAIKTQLTAYFDLLESDLILTVSLAEGHDQSKQMDEFVREVADLSPRLSIQYAKLDRTPSFRIDRPDEESRITFAAIPLGHELESFVIALLQISGRPPKVDPAIIDRVSSIKEPLRFETFISLSCHICPAIVQALNLLSVINPNISHVTIDGGLFREEVAAKDIMAVPTVYLNGEEWSSGRTTLEEIVDLLTDGTAAEIPLSTDPYDVLVIGGGPAGVSASIYAARKGIRTALVAERIGGQILETVGIDNVIGTPHTEGSKLAANYAEHLAKYPIDKVTGKRVSSIEQTDSGFELTLDNGGVLKSTTVVVASGARWRPVNVPGEVEFKNKGVAYCPHCDGPLYENKRVAVIGGGNSGVEAALDLAQLTEHVTLIEFLPQLKADMVLQEKLYQQKNVTVVTNAATREIHGERTVNALSYRDRDSGEETKIDLAGVFVQIGLVPSTDWLNLPVEKTRMGEIVVDRHHQSSIPGLFAAGDCTDSVYKQIVIATGSGASAALGAFDYLIREGRI